MPKLSHLAVLAFAGASVACASDAPTAMGGQGGGRSCFLADDLAGWKEAKAGRVNLRTTRNDYYQAQLLTPCPDLDFSQQLAVVTRVSERICEGDDATLVIPQPRTVGPDRCRIDRVRKLTAEEVAAMAAGEKP